MTETSGFGNNLLDVITDGIHKSRWFVLYNSIQEPYRVHTYLNREGYKLQIFIWELIKLKKDFYSVKPNNVKMPFLKSKPDEKNLVLGWLGSAKIFLGFDHTYYPDFEENCLIHVPDCLINMACHYGLYGYSKDSSKSIFAFEPAMFMEYAIHLETIHDFSKSPKDLSYFNLMVRTAREE